MLIRAFLSLRLKSITRQVIEFGGLGLLLIVFFIIQLFHRELYSLTGLIYWTLAYLLGFTSIHINRKDKDFIKLYFNKVYIIYFTEYFILSLPLIVSFLVYHAIWHLIALISIVFIVSFLTLNSYKQKIIPMFFSSISLEWRNGLRRYYIVFILLLIGESIGAFYGNLNLTFTLTYIAIIFTSDFIIPFEPKYYLLQHFGRPKYIIIRLLKTTLVNFFMCNILYFIIFFIFFPKQIFILFQIISTGILLQTSLVLLKYAVFRSINQLLYYIVQIILVLFCLLCLSIPIFCYGYFIIIPVLFLLAVKKIAQITND